MQLILVRLADYLLFDLSVCDTSKGGQTTLDGCQNGLLKSPEDGWGVSSRLYSCSMILHFGEVFWYFISLFECISLCLDHLFGEGRFQQGTLKVAPLGSSSTQTAKCYILHYFFQFWLLSDVGDPPSSWLLCLQIQGSFWFKLKFAMVVLSLSSLLDETMDVVMKFLQVSVTVLFWN